MNTLGRLLLSAVLAIALGIVAGVLFFSLHELFSTGRLCLLDGRQCADGMIWGLVIYAPLFALASLVAVTPIIFIFLGRRNKMKTQGQ